jgi:GNAT superfamily N-acetyltransferase
MDSAVHIRRIRPEDRQAVDDLHREHYWRSNCLVLNPDFYHWQFEEPPDSAALGGDQSVVAVDDDGKVLSFLGVVPARASFRNINVSGAHLITWLSAPAARGRGVGRRLMTWMTEQYEFLFGRSVTPAALAIYRQLGFRYFGNCSRWIAVLDPEAALSLAVEPSEATAKRVCARAVRGSWSSFHLSREVPHGVGDLSRGVLSDSLTFDRTDEYLAWRYARHPCLPYEFLVLGGSSGPDGFAVFRVEEVSGRGGRVLRVVEFIAATGQGKRLAEALFAHGHEQSCAYVDLFGISERFVSGFIAGGGFDALEESEIQLPHLLQPWDANIEPPGVLFFGRRRSSGGAGEGLVDDISSVHVSKGDGNLDWPSWVPGRGGASIAPPTRLAL